MYGEAREAIEERLKPGDTLDSGSEKASASLLPGSNIPSPDTLQGVCSSNHPPGLNKLCHQSSAETNDLGETITSGYSRLQGSHSFAGSDRDKWNSGRVLWERVRPLECDFHFSRTLDSEFLDRYGCQNVKLLAFRHLTPRHERLAFSENRLRVGDEISRKYHEGPDHGFIQNVQTNKGSFVRSIRGTDDQSRTTLETKAGQSFKHISRDGCSLTNSARIEGFRSVIGGGNIHRKVYCSGVNEDLGIARLILRNKPVEGRVRDRPDINTVCSRNLQHSVYLSDPQKADYLCDSRHIVCPRNLQHSVSQHTVYYNDPEHSDYSSDPKHPVCTRQSPRIVRFTNVAGVNKPRLHREQTVPPSGELVNNGKHRTLGYVRNDRDTATCVIHEPTAVDHSKRTKTLASRDSTNILSTSLPVPVCKTKNTRSKAVDRNKTHIFNKIQQKVRFKILTQNPKPQLEIQLENSAQQIQRNSTLNIEFLGRASANSYLQTLNRRTYDHDFCANDDNSARVTNKDEYLLNDKVAESQTLHNKTHAAFTNDNNAAHLPVEFKTSLSGNCVDKEPLNIELESLEIHKDDKSSGKYKDLELYNQQKSCNEYLVSKNVDRREQRDLNRNAVIYNSVVNTAGSSVSELSYSRQLRQKSVKLIWASDAVLKREQAGHVSLRSSTTICNVTRCNNLKTTSTGLDTSFHKEHKHQCPGQSWGDDFDAVCSVYSLQTDRTYAAGNMNYDALFLQASTGPREVHGEREGNGAHPTSVNQDCASPLTKINDGGFYGHSRKILPPPLPISFHGANCFSSVHGQDSLLQHSRGCSQVPVKPQVPIPAVHLTSSPDGPGLNLASIDKEWERRGSKSSNRSHNSKSSGKGSNRFLGVNTGSAWTRWSRDRRASYRRRVEKLEQDEPPAPSTVVRISTPIKKARQEGLKFVHPDLEERYLSEDDLNELRRHKQQQVHAMRVIEKNRRNKFRLKTEVKINTNQWHMMQEFWDHVFFLRARYMGLLVSLIAFVFMVASVSSHTWVKHSTWNLTIIEGLWLNCTQPTVVPNSSEGCTPSNGRSFAGGLWDSCFQNHSDSRALAMCPDKRPHWQNGIIGLMIFATTFGFLASVLSICGVCTNPLPRKIYYFHSAGEIFLICAVSASIALLVFPIAVHLDSSISSHRYGIGYGLGWAGAFFFLAAAVCMSLDDLVRESSRAKCCRWCWRGKHSDRNDLRQV